MFGSFKNVVLVAALTCLFGFAAEGCRAVGPEGTQSVTGQKSANSPLDRATMIAAPDGSGTFTADARGPVRESLVDNEGIEARSTGMVTRDVIWTDGTNRVSVASGSDLDILAKGVEINPLTGTWKVDQAHLKTSSSEPMRALNEALDRYASVWAKLSEEQRAALEAQYAALVETVKVTVPAAADVLKGLLLPVP